MTREDALRNLVREVIRTELRDLIRETIRTAPGTHPDPHHGLVERAAGAIELNGGSMATVPVRRIERGAVTERIVRDAARAGERLVLGTRAVLTPLAADRARAEGVQIEKEHPC